jgi:16S rRNA (adenine1518-N6/adenine1519-N6)-dimethyltransferase
MNLPRLDIPSLLRQHGLRPEKSLGQNFLLDESALEQIVEIAGVTNLETVLEIGAGLGNLTRYLAMAARSVVAVELDEGLLPLLRHVLEPFPNIYIVQGDILALDPAQLIPEGNYLVVANIPYYITSALIRHLLESHHPPARLVLTIQKEVAQRICAAPGDLSLLALSVQVYGAPYIADYIPAEAFYPPPKVDSAILRVNLYPTPRIPHPLLDSFFRLCRAGFSQKRKTLRNALSGGLGWSTARAGELLQIAQIDPFRRAETLSLDEWLRLTQAYATWMSASL